MVSGAHAARGGMAGRRRRSAWERAQLQRADAKVPPVSCVGAGVIHNQQALCEMYAEFVGAPLWRHAQKAQGSSGRWAALAGGAWEQRTLLLAALGVSALAAGVLAYRRRSAA